MKVNGFIVVRIPSMNYLVAGRDVVPQINDIYYAGVDRNRWVDVMDEDYFKNNIPPEVKNDAAFLEASEFPSIELCKNAAVASRLLSYSNRAGRRNELIAIRSEGLEARKGWVETEVNVEWIGYDVFALGEWSLISQGLFMSPDAYAFWAGRINRHGLFDDPALVNQYYRAYEREVLQGNSEAIAPKSAGLGVISLEVGRVRLI